MISPDTRDFIKQRLGRSGVCGDVLNREVIMHGAHDQAEE